MANRMKEDERIERTIRGLLRLPENRRCINCNSLGPQYVCTTFLTFVCTNCSGVHREFTHRVKSVSVAKFRAEEVSALQAGGNERARQIYFKSWDTRRQLYPDASNIQRLRDFIKHVYVDRKYTGEKSTDKQLPRLRSNEKKESYESTKVQAYRGGSRSSSPGRRSEDGSFKYYYDERRSPQYSQENSRYGGFRRNPVRFEIVDDRFRENEYGSRNFSQFPKNIDRSLSPVVRSLRDILGDGIPPLQVGELSTAINGKDADGSPHSQKIESSSDQCSTDKSPAEHKHKISGSLIDLSTDSDPLDAETIPQTPQMPHSDSVGDMASIQQPTKEKAFQVPSANTFESLIFELSVPPVVPASGMSEGPSNDDTLSTSATGTTPTGVQQMPGLPISAGASTTASTTHYTPEEPFDIGSPQAAPSDNGDNIKISDKPFNIQQYHPTASSAADNSPVMQQTNTPVRASNDQLWISLSLPDGQGHVSAPTEQSSQAVSKSAQDTGSGAGSEPLSVETQSNGRKELPADLFTAAYAAVAAPVAGWQNGSPYGMGFGMHYYPNAMTVSTFPNSARSTNPFDLNEERTQVEAPPVRTKLKLILILYTRIIFPSMASLQGALPNVSAASPLLYTSSLSTQSSGAYIGTQAHNNMPPSRSQGLSGIGSDCVFGSLNTAQQSTGKYSASSSPNPVSSMGGNPFG
ncbi:probable ADP-ribosylation factor GTPase-activating protein AGD14 isoform X1 [Juglans microcarpa x Juglans regia]|uniref:probable ADP-ribosylation factor GTPase-activating protein AGD14 isoform X1 n=1 Tax=Juglans microcarpa x Juglans regia TaxID=2249226 RepID=UPI001B7F1746|nr:probable ADP-ribosylation factor GTPase-activating protein AGD14 isoform X1 [Juglans microcarpa x Juglans regia]